MEGKFEGQNQYLYGTVIPEMKGVGNRSLEWDLNDWKWDGDLFTARKLNSVPSYCRCRRQLFLVDPEIPENAYVSNNLASGCCDDIDTGEGRRELDKDLFNGFPQEFF